MEINLKASISEVSQTAMASIYGNAGCSLKGISKIA
jgi:hypothetical protein